MTTGGTTLRAVMLHGGLDDEFDRSVTFARQLAESLRARLHVVYTVEDPLSAGWTAEVSAGRLPEVHQAMEAEARERLSGLIPVDDQERLGVQLVLRTGPAATELIRYTKDHAIDMAIVRSPHGDSDAHALARALLDHAQCAVLVLR